MNHTDTLQLGLTFQMSLDSFLEDTHPVDDDKGTTYQQALLLCKEAGKYRSQKKKSELAKEAIELCADCIEAYELYAMNSRDIYKRITVLRHGMEQATMKLGKEYFLRKISDFYEYQEVKPLLRIKFLYALSLYEAGNITKALNQFHELLNLNPSDVFYARYYLSTCYLLLEQIEQARALIKHYPEDTFFVYITLFALLKEERIHEAIIYLPKLKVYNQYLFDIISYQSINTAIYQANPQAGSIEEASYCYKILGKVTQTMEYLPQFLMNNES